MFVEIWKQNILVTDSNLLKLLLVVFGFGSQIFICGFSRQNINSVRVRAAPILYCCHDFTPPQYPVHTPDCGQIFFSFFYQWYFVTIIVLTYCEKKLF